MNPIVPGSPDAAPPVQRASGSASAKKPTSTPLGITTASPPRCSTRVRRAYSLTAIRARIFSRPGCRIGEAAIIARDRGLDVWKVPTIGPDADQAASIDRLGEAGSCTCRMSNRPSFSQRRTLAAERMPKLSRATEPLYGTATARPAETTYGGSASSSSAGASTDTSWPRPIRCSARSRMWNCTPPGTSQSYGQTMPIFTGSS